MRDDLPTVVVIDDSPEVRALITADLRRSGRLKVVGAGCDGTEAVELAHRHQPELLLLDLSMPVMDGLEALPAILALSPNTNVVVYSGFDEQGLVDTACELGAVGFIEKRLPIDQLPDELLAVLPEPPAVAVRGPGPHDPLPDHRLTDGDQRVLDEHLEHFREVFDQAAIGMATMTLTGSVVRANEALAELMLCKPDELVGVDYGRLTGGQGDLFDAVLLDVTRYGAHVAHLEHDIAGTAPPRQVRATLAPVRGSQGEALYVFLQVQDITRERAAEDELRRTEERFRLLVEAVGDYAIFMLDPDGHVVSWNTGAQRCKGYAAEEIIGHHFRVFYPPDQRAYRHPERVLQLALRHGRQKEEGWRLRKDGTRFWANVVLTAVYNAIGEHIGFAKVTVDMTERRRAEEERHAAVAALRQANATLEQLNAQLQRAADEHAQLLAVTAHELRTPTSILGGSADSLSRHGDQMSATERGRLLDAMTRSADRLERLLSDLLAATKADASSPQQVQPVPTPLSAVLTTAVDLARSRRYAAGLTADLDTDVQVLADPERLAQALDNLVGNALDHGAPPVRVTVDTADDQARIMVCDSGGGVPATIRPRLFDRYTTGDAEGTGLGLYIARKLARAHGGDVTYEPGSPERPAGAFVLTVPLAPEPT